MNDENWKVKALYIVIPLLASGFGGGVGAFATISVHAARIEAIEKSVSSLALSASQLTITTTKAIGVLEERGPRINQLEVQVNAIAVRIDRLIENDRATRK